MRETLNAIIEKEEAKEISGKKISKEEKSKLHFT